MAQNVLSDNYVQEINNIKQEARNKQLSDHEITKILLESHEVLRRRYCSNKIITLLIKILFTSFIILVSYVVLYSHQPTTSLILRNVQGLIYPGFKFVRHLSMPIISLFPALTQLYDETCLLENPYFQVNNFDCWPCSSVHSVINLTGLNSISLHETGTPFVISELQRPEVSYEDIVQFYKNHSTILKDDIGHLDSSNKNLSTIKDLISFNLEHTDVHVSWRINRMLPVRYIRKLFPRPHLISEWSGQSMERYIFLDGPKSDSYNLPGLECPYVFLIQTFGQRTIKLIPTKECQYKCKSVSIVLKSSDILWYNWWYWKPISLSSENSTNISISYLNSYC